MQGTPYNYIQLVVSPMISLSYTTKKRRRCRSFRPFTSPSPSPPACPRRYPAKVPPSRKHCRSRGINKIYDVIHFGYESDLISSRRPDRTDCDNAIEWKGGRAAMPRASTNRLKDDDPRSAGDFYLPFEYGAHYGPIERAGMRCSVRSMSHMER